MAATTGATTAAATMQAVVQARYGSADVLVVEQVERPTIGDHEVLVRVHAAGLDRGTWHLLSGQPYLVRLGCGLRRPRNPVPGLDVAGTVVATGSAVTKFAVGDEVFGLSKGSFAEYAGAREDLLAHKPVSLPFDHAAALGVSALTALKGVRDAGRVEAGQRVLIVGASGGVGTFAVQLATALGAEVTGVCSTGKCDLVRAIGADHVIDYTRDDFAAVPHRYDVIIDIGGNSSLSRLRRALTPRGTLVMIGGENGGRTTGGFDRMLRGLALSPFVRQSLRVVGAKQHGSDLEHLAELASAGDLTSVIDARFTLEQAADAMRHLVSGKARGKIVITVIAA